MALGGVNGWAGVEFCSHGPSDLFPSAPRWVYYMHNPETRLVKIGTTVQLGQRHAALASEGRPDLEIRAVELGHYNLERRRHDQFQDLRTKSTKGHDCEWFRLGRALDAHIVALRRVCGDPMRLLDADCRCQLPTGLKTFVHEPYLRQRVEPWEGVLEGVHLIEF